MFFPSLPCRLAWLLLAASITTFINGAFAAAANSKPEATVLQIEEIRTSAEGDRTAVVRVPKGIHRIVLQLLVGGERWVTKGVEHSDGKRTSVTFKISPKVESSRLRVLGSADDHLPKAFYQGKTNFASLTKTKPARPYPPRYNYGNAVADDGGEETPTITESDIWKISGNTLYFFNQYRGLQIIDITNPDSPILTGTLSLPAVGEEMYVLDSGHVILLAHDYSNWSQSEIISVKIEEGKPSIAARKSVAGSIDTSRLVGSALYVASVAWRDVAAQSNNWGTSLSSFDFSDPDNPSARDVFWVEGYSNVTTAIGGYLLVSVTRGSDWDHSLVHLFDITSSDGTMSKKGEIKAAGSIDDKFKFGLNGDVLTLISQIWRHESAWRRSSKIETFSLLNPNAPEKLGELEVGKNESLFATRISENRAYVVTAEAIDPLWVIDLSNPEKPSVLGELEVPGFSTYIQLLEGNRLLALGIEGSRVAVSLFGVDELGSPSLLSRVYSGERYSWSEATFNEKAFSVFPEAGKILLPVDSYDTETGSGSHVQIIDIGEDILTKRGIIDEIFAPRRATFFNERILSISGRQLLTVDASNLDDPKATSDVALSWPVDRVFVQGDYLIEIEDGTSWAGDSHPTILVGLSKDPDNIVGEVILNDMPVVGATIQDGKLYVAQTAALNSLSVKPAFSNWNTGGKASLTLTSYDLTALPSMEPLGSATIETNSFGWNPELKALWPNQNLLVWSTRAGRNWPIYWMDTPGLARSSISPRMIAPWYGSSEGRLIAFDVTKPNAPTFVSETTFASEATNVGEAFAADGAVYSSHNGAWRIGIWKRPNGSDHDIGWANGWALDVIDYSVPGPPELRRPVSIPNELIGISEASSTSAILVTKGYPAWGLGNSNHATLDASAYDGWQAALIDSVPLSGWSTSAEVKDGNVYIAESINNSGNKGKLSAWSLLETGKWAELSSLEIPDLPYEVHVTNDLLSTRGNKISLFDVSDPAGIKLLDTIASPYTSDLDHSDGDLERGLWVPLGDYGVSHLETSE